MSRRKILIAESLDFSPLAIDLLSKVGEVIQDNLNREDLLSNISDVEVLWVRLRNKIDAEIISASSFLKFIVSPTTGLNHIDTDYAQKNGVTVLSLQNEFEFLSNIRASSEHTIALMLSLLRNIPSSFINVRQGYWRRDPFKGREIHEKTIGLIGFGRIGKLVAKYLKAFDCRLLVSDPEFKSTEQYSYVENVSLEYLLKTSDIISLHVNLCEKNHKFFDFSYFSLMKEGSFLINTSRGELIDEDVLLHFLQNGKLVGAAIDVLCDEHNIERTPNALISYAKENDNLLITPHTAGCTIESMTKTEIFMADKLISLICQENDQNICVE